MMKEWTLRGVKNKSKEELIDIIFKMQNEARDMVPEEEVRKLQDALFKAREEQASPELKDVMSSMKNLIERIDDIREKKKVVEENYNEFQEDVEKLKSQFKSHQALIKEFEDEKSEVFDNFSKILTKNPYTKDNKGDRDES